MTEGRGAESVRVLAFGLRENSKSPRRKPGACFVDEPVDLSCLAFWEPDGGRAASWAPAWLFPSADLRRSPGLIPMKHKGGSRVVGHQGACEARRGSLVFVQFSGFQLANDFHFQSGAVAASNSAWLVTKASLRTTGSAADATTSINLPGTSGNSRPQEANQVLWLCRRRPQVGNDRSDSHVFASGFQIGGA